MCYLKLQPIRNINVTIARSIMLYLSTITIMQLTCAGCFQQPSQKDNAGEIALEKSVIRITSPLDSGTIHAFVKNNTKHRISIKNINLNNSTLIGYPNNMVLWCQMLPPVLHQGKIGEVLIKLAKRPLSPCLLAIEFSPAGYIETNVPLTATGIKLTHIAFNKELSTVYVYVENAFFATNSAAKVFCDGNDYSYILQEKHNVITAGNKQCLMIPLSQELRQGEYISVKVIFADSTSVESVIRVFSAFPLDSYSGDNRIHLGFDKETFLLPYGYNKYFFKVRSPQAISVYNCPNCNDFKHTVAWTAAEITERNAFCFNSDSYYPTFIHLCSFQQHLNYPIYAGITDLTYCNPYEVAYFRGVQERSGYFYEGTPKKNYYWYKLAKTLAEPKQIGIIPAAIHEKSGRYITPEELRLSVYYGLAAGAKGILYFAKDFKGRGYNANTSLLREISIINAEIRSLRPSLAIGEPINIAESDQSDIFVQSVLCGSAGIALVVINETYESYFGQSYDSFAFSPQHSVNISVNIPSGWQVHKAYALHGAEKELVSFSKTDGLIRVTVNSLSLAQLIFLELKML